MSKSKKGIPAEDKVRLVEKYLKGEISRAYAAKGASVEPGTITLWARLYMADGPTALMDQKQNKKYPTELKLKAVTEYLSGAGSQNAICKKYHIRSPYQLRQWIKVYNSHGTFKCMTGGSYMKKARNTNPDERLKIVQECLANNENYGTMALNYEVSYQQVRNWVKRYNAMGSAGLEDRRGQRIGTQPSRSPEEELRDRIAQLEREKRDLKMENNLLKKVRDLERRRRLL
jgi:transposase-like protein